MSFAADPATSAYYERRADEYDEWYEGTGVFATRDRPGWHDELACVVDILEALPPARTIDVACGTGFLTRHLPGPLVVALDQSARMVARAQARLPTGVALVGDALALPFADGAFDRAVAGHFYGHLVGAERERFLAEARRVADELVVVDSALRPGVEPAAWHERVLNDGSRHRVFKRHLSPQDLFVELGARVLFAGRWFVVGRT